jgi:Spy/CpxP family protein refolding chaperone
MNMKRGLILAGCVVALGLGSTNAKARAGGGRTQGGSVNDEILEAQRKSLSVTNDDEWKVISPKLLRVVQLKMEAHFVKALSLSYGTSMGGFGGFGSRESMSRSMALHGLPHPAADPVEDALRKALDDEAPRADLNAAVAGVEAARQQKQADLTQAQSALRQVLAPRQAAVLESQGMLGLGPAETMAQGGGEGMGNLVLTKVLQEILEAHRKTLSVTKDAEWEVISPKLMRVAQLKLDAHAADVRSLFHGIGMSDDVYDGNSLTTPHDAVLTGDLRMRPDPAEDALKKALADQAPIAELDAAVAKVQAVRQQKQAEMTKAQSDLREVLTPRQAAVMVSRGILD